VFRLGDNASEGERGARECLKGNGCGKDGGGEKTGMGGWRRECMEVYEEAAK